MKITTYPAPPIALANHMKRYLQSLIDKGRYPPEGWVGWVDGLHWALEQAEITELALIAEPEAEPVQALDPSPFGVDLVRFVGTPVTPETLFILNDEARRHYGDKWEVLSEMVQGGLWKVTGVKAK